MFSLLHRQYDGIGEMLQAMQKAYVISTANVTDVTNMFASLVRIRNLLTVQMGPDEEDILRTSLWSVMVFLIDWLIDWSMDSRLIDWLVEWSMDYWLIDWLIHPIGRLIDWLVDGDTGWLVSDGGAARISLTILFHFQGVNEQQSFLPTPGLNRHSVHSWECDHGDDEHHRQVAKREQRTRPPKGITVNSENYPWDSLFNWPFCVFSTFFFLLFQTFSFFLRIFFFIFFSFFS